MAACELVCVCERVGGLHSLSLYNSKPHWYLEKEINIAISGGSRVRLCAQKTRLCTSEEERGTEGKKDEAENFPLVILPAELLACLESDAAWRHGSHLGSALTVNISTQAKRQRKVVLLAQPFPHRPPLDSLNLAGGRTAAGWAEITSQC